MTRLVDGDGAYVHYPEPGALSEQPAFDMEVFDLIKGRWNELRNEDIEKHGKQPKGHSKNRL